MPKDRLIRSRRRSLNPTKVVFVYCLTFILVCFHQAGRVAEWFDDLALRHNNFISETAFGAAKFFRETVRPYGPAQLAYLEDKTLAFFSAEIRTRLIQREPGEKSLSGLLAPSFSPVPKAESLPVTAPEPAPKEQLLPKSRQEGENEGKPPYAELPPIYWSLGPSLRDPAAGAAEKELQTASLFAPRSPVVAEKGERLTPEVVLLLGDSMMLEGLGPPLQRSLKQHAGLRIYRDGRYGTGLTRLDNFDWLGYFDEILDKYGNPDLVILTVGANDAQDMVGDGQRVHLGSATWNTTYTARIKDLLARAEARGTTVFWVGLPIMGREPYGSRIETINKLAYSACQEAANCRFWDSWLSVADSKGEYTAYMIGSDGKSVRIRAKDSIHLTEVGGRIMADRFLADIAGWVDFSRHDQREADEPTFETEDERPLAPSVGDEEGQAMGPEIKQFSYSSKARGKNILQFGLAAKLWNLLSPDFASSWRLGQP